VRCEHGAEAPEDDDLSHVPTCCLPSIAAKLLESKDRASLQAAAAVYVELHRRVVGP
jgi:hypothetical protein